MFFIVMYVFKRNNRKNTVTVTHKWDVDNWEIPLNPFGPEFTIVIFIHYKPRIAVAILDL